MRPLSYLHTLGKLYPNAWQCVEFLIANRGVRVPDWPEWSFLPVGGWLAIASIDNIILPKDDPAFDLAVARLAAVATWRYCQGVYRFDDEVRAALVSTEITGDIPGEVFLRLPEYCVYVETPGSEWFEGKGLPLYGFWAHLTCSEKPGEPYLNLLLDCEGLLRPIGLPIGNWSLLEAVKLNEKMAETHFSKYFGHQVGLPDPAYKYDIVDGIQPLLSLPLYLCSDEPEIENDREPKMSPKRPELTKTKKGWRLFPPDRCRVWHVGRATGETLRRASASGQRESKGVRPHLRRPHWHGFWTGQLNGERRFGYKWLPTIMVRGRINEEANGRQRNKDD
jgi:hypothetical protein